MYKKILQQKKMLLLLLISTISYSIANPIPQYNSELSGSASGSASGSEYDSEFNGQNTNHSDYTCEIGCKIFKYTLITILSCCLIGFCGIFLLIIYEACIRDMIRCFVKCIKTNFVHYKNKFCINCFKHTSRDNNQYIENDKFQKSLSYYDKFIIMYDTHYKNEKPLNTECPICLEPIKQNFYTLHCKHAYHTHCMKDYIHNDNYNYECALCRNTIIID